jgi:hypothetical protein
MAVVAVVQGSRTASSVFRLSAGIHSAMLVALFLQTLWIVLIAYFVYYFQHLEAIKCKCAISWRSNVLRGVLIAMILILVLKMFLRGQYGFLLYILHIALVLTFIVVSRQFLSQTHRLRCDCAKVPAFRVLDVVNIVMIFLFALVVILYGSYFIFSRATR